MSTFLLGRTTELERSIKNEKKNVKELATGELN